MTDEVVVTLSRPAALFLESMVGLMNQVKVLPADSREALQTSAWLEEIAAMTGKALDA